MRTEVPRTLNFGTRTGPRNHVKGVHHHHPRVVRVDEGGGADARLAHERAQPREERREIFSATAAPARGAIPE